MSLELTGMKDLLSKIEKMGTEAKRVKGDALKVGAEVIRKKMSEEAPKGKGGGNHIAENIVISDMKNNGVQIGPHKDYFYGYFLEFGTSKMKPKPFAEPAFKSSITEAQNKMSIMIKSRLGL